jgi:hypothetical protein
MKPCTTCGRWKPASEFYPDRREDRKPDSRAASCKDCECQRMRELRDKGRAESVQGLAGDLDAL